MGLTTVLWAARLRRVLLGVRVNLLRYVTYFSYLP